MNARENALVQSMLYHLLKKSVTVQKFGTCMIRFLESDNYHS